MKRLMSAVAAGSLVLGSVALFTSVAGADTSTTTTTVPVTTTTLAAPLQGATSLPLALTVDTVVASGSANLAYPLAGCAMTNEFIVGQTVVFRMWGQDSATGGQPLTGTNVASAVLTIPGVSTPVPMCIREPRQGCVLDRRVEDHRLHHTWPGRVHPYRQDHRGSCGHQGRTKDRQR